MKPPTNGNKECVLSKTRGKVQNLKISNETIRSSKKSGNSAVSLTKETKHVDKNSSRKMVRRERERLSNPEKFDLANNLKKIWEELRITNDLTLERRKELAAQMMKTIKGNAAKLVSAHDTCRVLQTLLKYGSTEQRDEIFEEMKPSFASLMVQKYAAHYLLKVLEYGSAAHRMFIIRCILGNTRRLLKNAHASKIVEEVFSKYAKPNERRLIVSDLCGATFRRLVNGDKAFRDVYQKLTDEETKERLLRSSKSALVALATNGNGRTAHMSVIHAALEEFLICCPVENPLRREVMDAWRDNIHGLLSSKTGVRCAQHFVWESNPKERKALVKSLKSVVVRLCADSDASLFILSIFDSVDDVVLVNKYIVKYLIGKNPTATPQNESEVADDVDKLEETFLNPVTRRLLLYILSPRDPHHFSPAFCQQLKSPVLLNGEPSSTKKTFAERLADLRRVSQIDQILLSFFLKQLPVLLKELNNDAFLALVTMLNQFEDCNGKRARAYALFSSLVASVNTSDALLSIESPVMNIALKRLLAGDKQRLENPEVAVEDLFAFKFMERIVNESSTLIPSFLASNRGCYILLLFAESNITVIADKCCQLLRTNFLRELSAESSSGAKLLLKKIC